MHGFINESVSKITDGIGGTIQLLAALAVSTILFIPVTRTFSNTGKVIYVLLLLTIGIYFLYLSLTPEATDARRASNGMLSGLLLWQVLSFSGFSGRWGLLDRQGYLLWLGAALIVALFWNKVFPIGLRFLFLLILLNWLGKLFIISTDLQTNWAPLWMNVFQALRYLGAVGIIVSLWFIILKSGDPLQRKYGAAALYFFILLAFMLF